MTRLAFAGVAIAAFAIPAATSGQQPWQAPKMADSVSIRNGRTSEPVSLDAMCEDLAGADVVFLGETHKDETTHRFELYVLEQMIQRRDKQVVLAMEMFERDVQTVLDDYLAGRINEEQFLARGRPWGNYNSAYRPLVETAKSESVPVIASNFPRPLLMKMNADSPEKVLANLGEHSDWAPAELLANSDLYWKRTDNAVRGHLAMMRSSGDESRLYSTQSLWDNAMGESCAKAMDRYPDRLIVHVNGGFHTAYWDGTAGQLRQRKPDAKVKTISIVPATNPSSEELRGEPVADYVVFADNRASDEDDGRWSVEVGRPTHYQIHIPDSATHESPVPMLIWLGDDGLTAQDGLEYWRSVLGDRVAILVLDPPFREQQPDLSVAGRWFWLDDFSTDIGNDIESIERAWGYVLRHYPVDPQRICLAGEGTGATVATAATVLTSRMSLAGVALEPRGYSKLKDFPLPLLEDWGQQRPPHRTLAVVGQSSDGPWWSNELEQYSSVEVPSRWIDAESDPWQREQQRVGALCQALKISIPPSANDRTRQYIAVDTDSILHLHWARLAAQKASSDAVHCIAVRQSMSEGAERMIPDVTARVFQAGTRLPLCPGPFGGTTIVVVDPQDPQQDLDSWLALEKNDPIQAHSRFHRLRIATTGIGSAKELPLVLDELKSQNRSNVLIVPAVFYAGAPTMVSLEKQARNFANQMTIHWLPGLGGQSLPLRADK